MIRTVVFCFVFVVVLCSEFIFAANVEPNPIYVFCGTGDNLHNHKVEPVDSFATIDAMFEWMSQTHQIKRMYWRGGQQEMWRKNYRAGNFNFKAHDWVNWCNHLFRDIKINDIAVASAKRHGMEIFLYTALFEHGVQPDVGAICPHQFEDELRIDNPEWCPLDRWGQRRCPGPISFAYPQARQAIIDRLIDHIVRNGYDGVNFYTYVENFGIRYEDEFGFNRPVVDEFNKRYPDIDLRKDTLTKDQKEHWYKCRGKFVTDFLSELHSELTKNNKKLSMILDAAEPDYAQRWWGKPIRGTGNIHLDWEEWIDHGIVDEIWVQLGAVKHQQALLDRLLVKCADKPIKLIVRTASPRHSHWRPYLAKGVTPVAVITAVRNGIEQLSLKPTSLETLESSDWKLKAQTLSDIAHGKIKAAVSDIALLAGDPHVLVRHRAMKALSVLGGDEAVLLLEKSLTDPEASVRIAAADSLAKWNRPQTAGRIMSALESNNYFQFKNVCFSALVAIGSDALPAVLSVLDSSALGGREVCVRYLFKMAIQTADGDGKVYPVFYKRFYEIMMDSAQDWQTRCLAMEGLVGKGWISHAGIAPYLSHAQREQLVSGLIRLIEKESNITVQLRAAKGLRYLIKYLDQATYAKALTALTELFNKYGDACGRTDAAFGWRIVGNTIASFDPQGNEILESMRKQTEDKWLAWLAYEVLYVVQKDTKENKGFNLLDENEAIENNEKYAPAFPGWRKW